MKLIGFLGAYDKTNLIVYVAKMLTLINKKVLIVDTTIEQRARYIIPTLSSELAYVTNFEGIDIAVGFESYVRIAQYMGTQQLNYDYILVDADSSKDFEEFKLDRATKNYFVTSFSLYSIRRGIETIKNINSPVELTKVIFSRDIQNEDNVYLEYLTSSYQINWSDSKIYFPTDSGDETAIIENEKAARIRFKNLSQQYRDGLIWIAEELIDPEEISIFEKALKNYERGE